MDEEIETQIKARVPHLRPHHVCAPFSEHILLYDYRHFLDFSRRVPSLWRLHSSLRSFPSSPDVLVSPLLYHSWLGSVHLLWTVCLFIVSDHTLRGRMPSSLQTWSVKKEKASSKSSSIKEFFKPGAASQNCSFPIYITTAPNSGDLSLLTR